MHCASTEALTRTSQRTTSYVISSRKSSNNTSVGIGDELEGFINNQVQAGRCSSVSEVVRAGLRHLQTVGFKLAALRAALQAELDSGEAEPFDFCFIMHRSFLSFL